VLRGAQTPFVGVAASVGAGLKLCVSPSPPRSELPYPGRRSPRRLQAASAARERCGARLDVPVARRGSFGLGAEHRSISSISPSLSLLCLLSDSYHHRWRFLSPSREPGRRTSSTVVLHLEAPADVRPGSEACVYSVCISVCISICARNAY